MKKIILSLMIFLGLFAITGCVNYKNYKIQSNDGKENNNVNENYNVNENKHQEENNAKSEFEQAIINLKNAKSVTIDYYRTTIDPDFKANSKYKLIIDYKNNKIKSNMYYYYISLSPNSDTSADTYEYWDISLKRNYSYDKKCSTWWYYVDSEVTYPVYQALEKVKTFTDSDITKKVGYNYRVVGEESFDILVENNKVKGVVYSPKNNKKVSISYGITVEDYDKDYVTLPSEVKKALSESELYNVCDN